MSLLGGVASPIGSAIGTGLLILIPEWLRFLKSVPGLYLAIYGLSVILIIRYMPDGIWGFVNIATERWRAQKGAPLAAAPLQWMHATVVSEYPAVPIDDGVGKRGNRRRAPGQQDDRQGR